MTTIVRIIGTGTEMEVEPEIVNKSDDYKTLRTALNIVTQGIPKAKISEKKEGENTIIEVQPKLDGKGYGPDDYLQECPEQRNPTIEMFLNLNSRGVSLGSHEMYSLGLEANAALTEGDRWIEMIEGAEKILLNCRPAESSIILPG
jgi:hypothetical protein